MIQNFWDLWVVGIGGYVLDHFWYIVIFVGAYLWISELIDDLRGGSP